MEGIKAINHLEEVVVQAGGAVLRYGALCAGAGATDDQIGLVRKRMYPLVGGGTGYMSWVHVDDAAGATVLALEKKATGVFNIVDETRHRYVSGSPISRSALAPSRRGGSQCGWPGCSPAR